jgi:hypothetical protein
MSPPDRPEGEYRKAQPDGRPVSPPTAAIVGELEQTFSTTGLEPDVLGFLDIAVKQRWVEWA